MRLSTSSSLIFATIALSSSSSTLAAPTDSGALQRNSFSSSPSLQSVAIAGREPHVDLDLAGNPGPHVSASADPHGRRQLPPAATAATALLPPDLPGPLQTLMATLMSILGMAPSAPSPPSGVPGVPAVAPPPVPVTPAQLDAVKQALAQALEAMKDKASSAPAPPTPGRRQVDSDDDVTVGDGSDDDNDDNSGDGNDCVFEGDDDDCDGDECDAAPVYCSDSPSSTASKRSSAMLDARDSSAMTTDSTSSTLSVPSPSSESSTGAMSNTAPTSPALPANPPNTPVPTSTGDATATASSTMA